MQTVDGLFGEVECRIEVRRLGHELEGNYSARVSRLAYVVQDGETLGVWAVVRLPDRIVAASPDRVAFVASRLLEGMYGRLAIEVS
ncbi:MAG: hypothetical protein JNL79_03575 [Myxococcales bacterium]|nr:hypothetical protein [Myxococcales bacterium]